MSATEWIDGTIALCKQLDNLLWVYVFIWAVIIVRKLFYA